MNHAGQQTLGYFREIPAEECRRLLAEHHAGRVAWSGPEGPQMLPVSYTIYAGDIVFRTSAYGVLGQLVHPTNVAFEIDDIDDLGGPSWSVVVRGRAKAVLTSHELVTLWTSADITPRAPGTRNVWITVSTDRISGRFVTLPTWTTTSAQEEVLR